MIVNKRIFGNEKKYVNEVLETEFRSSKGSVMMKRLEDAFANRFDSKYAISAINGTATLHAILEAMEIGIGDEVIVPPLTMSSTSFAVLQANATPIFADVDFETFQIDPKSIEKCITDKTKAIMTVALYGACPDMDAIMEIANRHNLFVIEDNAECFLGKYKGKLVGNLGHAASFSFQSSKHLTAGEGGMITTNDLQLAQKIRKVCSLGYAGVDANKAKISKLDIQDPNYSRHISMGWNYRMSELCAAVALGQLENIDLLVSRRIQVAEIFQEIVNKCSWLVPQKVDFEYESSYWTYVVRLAHPNSSWNSFRDKFLEFGGDGIYSTWKLTYLEPMFENMTLLGREKFISEENKRKYKVGLCPNAEKLQPTLLQFKTNYWELEKAYEQAKILEKTINYFNKI